MTFEEAMKLAQKSDFLMSCQERTGVAFNITKAKTLYEFCCSEMERIEKEVEPKLPTRPLGKAELAKVTPPKIQFKNSKKGLVPSKHCENFFDMIDKGSDGEWIGYSELGGKWYDLPFNEPVTTVGPMRLKNQKDMKDWFVSLGWKPTLWNFQKDSNNKFKRDDKGQLIKTSPKFHDKGTLCPNLERLGDKIELVKPVVRWLSLRNRRSVICNPEKNSGWLNNPRLAKDGRLPAGASSITNTHRQKHKVVANIPRVSSVLGLEMRELFCAPKGKVLVGYDAAGLEARVEAHWCFKHEGGEAYAYELLEGDTHSNNARLFYGEDIPAGEDGKVVSKYRDPSKNGKYALTYGCTAPKLAETLGVPAGKANELFDNFWNGNTALASLRDKLTKHWASQGEKLIVCPLTGYKLHSRSKHSLVNLLFQHTGAIIMDYSLALMDRWLGGITYDCNSLPMYKYKGHEVRRVLYYHDEGAFECSEDISQDVLNLGIKSIVRAGEMLNLNVPLDADGSIGATWANIH